MKKIKKKPLSLIILILIAFLPKLPSFDTHLTIFYPSKYNRLNNDTFAQLKTAQENLLWNCTWDNASDIGMDIWVNGTYIYTCGSTGTLVKPLAILNLLLIKWDSSGNQLWNRTWGGDCGGSGTGIWVNGTYIYTCGGAINYTTHKTDMLLIKWDSNGNQLWNRTWGDVGDDVAWAIWGIGPYIYICGDSQYLETTSDLTVVKWDSDGNYKWRERWGGANNERGLCIWGDEDNYPSNLYVGGYTESYGEGGFDVCILKLSGVVTSSFPSLDWNYTWGSSGDHNDMLFGIWSDGVYLYTTGVTNGIGMGSSDLLLIKWQMNGDKVWHHTWGGVQSDGGSRIWGNGSFLYTCGSTKSFGDGSSDCCLIKWDNKGNQVWNYTWGGPYDESLNSIRGDGPYIYTTGKGSSGDDTDLALMKWEFKEHLKIELKSPLENLVYESGIQIDIDIERELVILDDVLYKWDGDGVPDIGWQEPYTTNLPIGDGIHTLYVSTTTTAPHISDSKSFTFITDDTDPIVEIQSPTTNENFANAPAYDLDITEPNIDEIWYTLNDGSNHLITTGAGEISDSAWNALPDGDVTIKFYVSDIVGHIGSDDVLVQKDTKAGQREIVVIIRNAIITASITGVIGTTFFLVKRKIGKKKDKVVPESEA